MPLDQKSLSPYEQKVDQLVRQIVATNKDRLTLYTGDGGVSGYYWQLAPKTPGAAKAHIYAVSETRINVSIENFYWIEVTVDHQNWDEALWRLGAYLQAIIDGRIAGWYAAGDNGKPQYVIEFYFGEEEPIRYSSNVHFPTVFKDRDDVSHIIYQKYTPT